jgi:hypothetical protein
MTHRERILAVCRGEAPDRIAWVPRLDLWYAAHSRAGTLPEQFRGKRRHVGGASPWMTLREITDAMGVGYHAVIPDFSDVIPPDGGADRGLGVYHLKGMAYDTRLHEVEREVAVRDGVTRVIYRTPVGSVSCAFRYTEEMRQAGASISWVDEHVLKGPGDYRVLEYIFSHLEVVPTYDSYRAWHDWVGEAGVAVAYGNAAASPMQHIMRDLLPMTEFFLELHDHPEHLRALAEAMEPWFAQVLSALVRSPAEIILWGGNYDETITYPPFFEQHILLWLARAAEAAHAHGKLLLTHTDGENAGLVDLYRRAGFDIADSLCPAPMTKLTLAQAIAALPGITIWGGIPSVALVEESMSQQDFERLIAETISLAAGRSHLILGIADTTPANASFDRLRYITRAVL